MQARELQIRHRRTAGNSRSFRYFLSCAYPIFWRRLCGRQHILCYFRLFGYWDYQAQTGKRHIQFFGIL